MKRIASFLLFFLLINTLLIAQNNPGLLMDDAAYETLTLIEKEEGVKYPINNTNSLKRFCPIPGDQGNIGSCVGWATGYHALTISRAIQDSLTEKNKIQALAHSASYIYNQIKKDNDCEKGAYLTDALHFLKNYGSPFSSVFRNSKFDCTEIPTTKVAKVALNNRIKNFYPIFKAKALDSIKIEETRLWISKEKPVIIAINLTKDFEAIALGQKNWTPDFNQKTEKYHAMVAVGYDDIERKFELINSYGPNWGNQGFIKIDYEDYGKLVKYAFVLDSIGINSKLNLLEAFYAKESLAGSAKPNTLFSTTSTLRKVVYNQDGFPFFKDATVYFDASKGVYRPVKESWEQFDEFQVSINQLNTGRYLYAFSFDAKNEVVSCFPPDDPLAAITAFQNTEVFIPYEQGVLELTHSGRDYVCLLYSNLMIEDFENRLKEFKTAKGYFKDRLQQVFGDLLVNQNLVEYKSNTLSFNYEFLDTDKQVVVPMILVIEVE